MTETRTEAGAVGHSKWPTMPEDLRELHQQALAELCHFNDKWPSEAVTLIERIAALTAQLHDAEAALKAAQARAALSGGKP